LRVQFELKFRDMFLFNMMHQFHSVTLQLFCALPPLMSVYFAEKGESIVLTIVTAIFWFFMCWLSQIVFLAIYLAAGNTRTVLTPKVIELQDDALFEETKFNRSYHYWPGILKAVRRPNGIAIYTSALAAHMIPNRAFLNEIARERFWTALNLKLKDPAAKMDAL
jgi:hypothetical protein